MARAALDAGETKLAREQAEAALRLSPRESAYLLLADIEEVETGNQGKVRQLLAKALSAPRDPVWMADGIASETWAPVSPATGRLDAFEWRGPEERIGRTIELREPEPSSGHDDEMGRETALTLVPPATTTIEAEPVRADTAPAQPIGSTGVLASDAEPGEPVHATNVQALRSPAAIDGSAPSARGRRGRRRRRSGSPVAR